MAIAALRAQGFLVLDAGDLSPNVRQRFAEELQDQPVDYLRSAILLRSEADKRFMDDAAQWDASYVGRFYVKYGNGPKFLAVVLKPAQCETIHTLLAQFDAQLAKGR